ncbi:uncharacterized protein LOC110082574 [Pogona vitticeps]
MARSSHPMESLALGRQLQLGMLYDGCKEAPIPGALLWDEQTLRENIRMMPNPGSKTHVLDSDTLEDKLSALKVPESLKASLLCKLVEAKGSARFLEDSRSSGHQARVTLQYSMTTLVKHLHVANLPCPGACHPQTATHVVTGAQYGAQVFFVFDQEVPPSEDLDEIRRDLQALVKRIPRCLSEEGEGMAKRVEEDQARIEKITCRIHGDVVLEDHPVTFQEALDIYSTLPRLLPEKAVPVRIWLHPLSQLGSKAECPFREISSEHVSEIQDMLQQLLEKDLQCNDLARNPAAVAFPGIKRKLQQFQGLIHQFRANLQKRLAKTIPLIRRGEEEEEALAGILTNQRQALFSSEPLGAFLENREKEMMLVNSYLDVLKGVEVVATKKELDRVLANPLLKRVIAFVFCSLQDEEPYISELENSLALKKSPRHGPPASANKVPDSKLWFEDRGVIRRARGMAKAFLGLAPLASEDTKLVVSALPDQDHPGVSIYLYEEGELVSTSLEPPSKPFPPGMGEISHDAVQLIFKPAPFGEGGISGYRIESRIVGQGSWMAANTSNKQETFTVTGLRPQTTYQFRYAALGRLGPSESSDVSDPVATLPLGSPGEPENPEGVHHAIPPTCQEVSLAGPDSSGQPSGPGKAEEENRKPSQEGDRAAEQDGKPVRSKGAVRASCERPAVAPERDVSQPGDQRAVDNLVKQSTLLQEEESLSIYHLPLQKSVSSSSTFIKYRLGHNDPRIKHKVIMMMGATGSGKTTLINGMANYILGVQWEDPFRFKLIHEETRRGQDQSQTSEVTAYEINYRRGFQISYHLTIIDTPGFGDTRGIENDKLITEKVREFFSTPGGIDHIDGVCFVVQASLARLTHTQKYIFDSVLSIFGKDIKTNVQLLVTFADGQTPPVLQAVLASEVPCAKDDSGCPVHFKFNNSALFASNSAAHENSPDFSAMFWKMGISSMKSYFESLLGLEAKSLRLTREVLRERKRLEIAIEGLQPQIRLGLLKLEEIRKTKQALEHHEGEMNANKDFQVEIEKPVTRKLEVTDGFLTNCQKCSFTCHYPCFIPNDKDKHKCAAMDIHQYCTVCPGKCFWNVHFNQKYRWEYTTVKEKQTYAQIKKKYEKACGEVMTTAKIFEQLSEEYEGVKVQVLELIEESSRSIERLQEIALRPSPMATPEHIDLLIESEKQEAKAGFQERIKSLETVKEMAVIVNKIGRGEPLLPLEEKVAKKYKTKPPRYQRIFSFVTEWLSRRIGDPTFDGM